MTIFQFIVFIHIVCAIMWIGTAVVLELLEWEATQTSKRERLAATLHRSSWFATRVFAPFSIATLLTGVLAVTVGRPTFGQLWVIIALVMVVLVSIIGGAVIGRTSAKLSALLANPDVHEDEVEAKLLSIRGFVYLDLAILFFILFDMVVKPLTFDPAFFSISGVFLLAVFGLIMYKTRQRRQSERAV